MTNSIFIVEDDDNQREFLETLLVENGFQVRSAANGLGGLKMMAQEEPDLVLLDLGLPDIEGESVFTQLKRDYPQIAVILLTARGKVSDIVDGLTLGADDYIAKPYNAEELLARIKARLKKPKNPVLKLGDLEVDTQNFEVRREGKKINLTPKEFKLFEYLAMNAGQVLSRETILARIWMYSPDMDSRAVDVYIGYLRKKIDNGHSKKLIQSVRGFGYRLKVEK